MAEIVLAIGTSHSPMLNSPAEEARLHAEVDKGLTDWKRGLVDKSGNKVSYDELLALADPELADQVTDEVIAERVDRCNANIAHVAGVLAEAEPDIVIVVGDDQHEQFFEDNMPSILVYWGETIVNTIPDLPETAPEFWKRARSMFHEDGGPRDYPVASELGRHVIEHLIDADFDVSQSKKLPRQRGEGHAFGFVHKQLMRDKIVPILPIALNTYFPPNQPRPGRCYALGRAIRDAVRSWPADARVIIVGSGGLSHFTVDEDLDRGVLAACRDKDRDALINLPLEKLRSGNSEIRNWITVAGAAEDLETTWQDYVPYYRSEAGTGIGAAFAVWSPAGNIDSHRRSVG